jgi:hypothetical protein
LPRGLWAQLGSNQRPPPCETGLASCHCSPLVLTLRLPQFRQSESSGASPSLAAPAFHPLSISGAGEPRPRSRRHESLCLPVAELRLDLTSRRLRASSRKSEVGSRGIAHQGGRPFGALRPTPLSRSAIGPSLHSSGLPPRGRPFHPGRMRTSGNPPIRGERGPGSQRSVLPLSRRRPGSRESAADGCGQSPAA